MSRANKTILLTMGSAMLISSGLALAASPISYGQFTANNGTITTGAVSGTTFTPNACPTGFSCGAAITGNGFMQRQITVTGSNPGGFAVGTSFFQTIILDQNASVSSGASGTASLSAATFADESFVQQGGGTGIADSSHVFATPTSPDTSTFTGDTAINVGWAKASPSENLIDVHQTISDPNKASMDFSLTDASTDNSTPIVTLNETVYMPPTSGPATGDMQVFYLKQLQAPSASSLVALPGTSQLTYNQNDILQVMWLGQQVTGGTTGGAQLFGTQTYTVNPTSATPQQVSYSSQTATGPNWDTGNPNASWDAIFGTMPTF